VTKKLEVLIVDDEPLARAKLQHLLASEDGVEIVGEAGDAETARGLVRRLLPDLVLLDIQMPGADGFELLESIAPEDRPDVVFVTAHEKHAVRAFNIRAVDYLLKPFDSGRLHAALERAREVGSQRAGDAARGEEDGYLSRFVIRSVGRILLVEAEEVDWLEAAANYVRIHHRGESHLLRETMGSLESMLDPARFARIHRSTIVNLDRVKELQHILHGDYAVLLRDGTRLVMSRSYREHFERLISRWSQERRPA